jgi:hypothetical protein
VLVLCGLDPGARRIGDARIIDIGAGRDSGFDADNDSDRCAPTAAPG